MKFTPDDLHSVPMLLQEPMLALPLRQRTHSIESTPDDLLSPKTQSLETKAATLLQTPAHHPFAPLPSACKATAQPALRIIVLTFCRRWVASMSGLRHIRSHCRY